MTLFGNPLITMQDGTEKVSVPSTFLPEAGEHLTAPTGSMFSALFPSGTPGTDVSTVASAVGDVAQAAAGIATGGAFGGSIGGASFAGIVTVVIGILLIAAGIFSFKPARETIIQTAKTAAVAA